MSGSAAGLGTWERGINRERHNPPERGRPTSPHIMQKEKKGNPRRRRGAKNVAYFQTRRKQGEKVDAGRLEKISRERGGHNWNEIYHEMGKCRHLQGNVSRRIVGGGEKGARGSTRRQPRRVAPGINGRSPKSKWSTVSTLRGSGGEAPVQGRDRGRERRCRGEGSKWGLQ